MIGVNLLRLWRTHVTDATFFGRLFTRLYSYGKFMKILPLELPVDTEDPALVMRVGEKKRIEQV